VSELLMIEPRPGSLDAQPWILDRHGRKLVGLDHDRRLTELRTGLARHPNVRSLPAQANPDRVAQVLGSVHEAHYLDALARARSPEPLLMPGLAAPGMAPDTPLCGEVALAAFEGVRTAITAAQEIVAGARFTYALCRPPGHHAGPGWLGGYCYLNNAAAAAQVLREAGTGPVGILDLDIHYPNGTAAIAEHMTDVSLHSLHAWPVANAPAGLARARTRRERLVEFAAPPTHEVYLEAVTAAVAELTQSAAVLVVSLGYDTVEGDPHGCWSFSAPIFADIGRLLARAGVPVCVVQEGGYQLDSLAACGEAFATGLLEGNLP
jgi:acetoin utilization deacetylase AcuC-like enzyme